MTDLLLQSVGQDRPGLLERPLAIPPLWVLCYLGSIVAAGAAGSESDAIAGANVEHILLGAGVGLATLFLLFEGNFPRIDGLNHVLKYLSLFGLPILLGLLSSIRPGPTIVGAPQLFYWCGLVLSIGVAALAALRGYTRWVLAVVALTGLPLVASVLQPFVPSLAGFLSLTRLHEWHQGRATGLFANPNWTGFGLCCSIAGCFCYYCFARRRLVKAACLLLPVLYGAGVLLTLSRASILLMLLTVLAFLYVLWRKAAHRWLIVLLAIVVTLAAARRVFPHFSPTQMKETRVLDASVYGRETFRFQGLTSAAHNLPSLFALGEGSGQFREVSGRYIDRWGKSPHNQILAIWVEWGFLAVLLMYGAHLWILFHGLRRPRWRHDDAQFMLLAVYAFIVLQLQLHGANSPASCALLGLCAGHLFRRDAISLQRDPGTDLA